MSVEIKIQKTDSPTQHIELRDFVSSCAALQKSISNVGRCVVGKPVVFEVDQLEIGSARVGVGAIRSESAKNAILVANVLKETLQAIENNARIDERLDYQALKAFDAFSSVINRGHDIVGQNLKLTNRFVTHLNLLLENEDPALGSVTGLLEIVDVHGSSNKFTLFTDAHNERVSCVFKDDDLPKILQAVKKKVTVYGTVFYSQRKIFPSRVEVDTFEVLPDDVNLSTLLEFKDNPISESRQPNG